MENKVKKNIEPCEIKLSQVDVMQAITMFLNEQQIGPQFRTIDVKKTREKGYFLIAKVDDN